MNETNDRKFLRRLDRLEERTDQLVEGIRQQQSAQNDEIIGIVKSIRQDVGWLREQWERFKR